MRFRAAADRLAIPADIEVAATLGVADVDALVDQQTGAVFDDADFAPLLTAEVLEWRQWATPYERAVIAVLSVQTSAALMQELLSSITGPIAEEYLYRRGCPVMKNTNGLALRRPPLNVSIPHIQSLRLPYLVTAHLANDAVSRGAVANLRAQHARNVEALRAIPAAEFIHRVGYHIASRPGA